MKAENWNDGIISRLVILLLVQARGQLANNSQLLLF